MPEFDFKLDDETKIRAEFGDFIMSIHEWASHTAEVTVGFLALSEGWEEFPGDDGDRKTFIKFGTHALMQQMNELVDIFQKAHTALFGEPLEHKCDDPDHDH